MVRKKYKFISVLFLFMSLCFFFLFCFPVFIEEKLVNNKNIFFVDKYKKIVDNSYLGLLEIPSISLKAVFYEIDSPFNNVNRHLYVVPGSTMPTEVYSNLIIAGHSGFSSVAYFKNLSKLSIGGNAFIYYQEKVYTYQLVSVYQEEKDGTITIHRKKNKSHLTLITCNQKNKNMQDVYILELISIV